MQGLATTLWGVSWVGHWTSRALFARAWAGQVRGDPAGQARQGGGAPGVGHPGLVHALRQAPTARKDVHRAQRDAISNLAHVPAQKLHNLGPTPAAARRRCSRSAAAAHVRGHRLVLTGAPGSGLGLLRGWHSSRWGRGACLALALVSSGGSCGPGLALACVGWQRLHRDACAFSACWSHAWPARAAWESPRPPGLRWRAARQVAHQSCPALGRRWRCR